MRRALLDVPVYGSIPAGKPEDLVVKGNKTYLQAENPRYSNLIPQEDLVVKGVAVAVIRQVA
jgi:hypothetical protein